ncbi:hypothetical protein C7Y66_09755 [Chroococcidiopsis sp. CCALA 051]|uniref:DUF5996 family protein n=1 Tax=Chroococcidiopsis sp. CCALA 051 TaxID=869949 RepID=UPI000D0CD87A|nr:DUF5996 family protein [Chroococcidiopsis sp. CCALA 051]PSM49290.1 hypothetical protein C7Y66_09755 [Chroococcidiopsis sp. CCALA 051]
MAQTIAESQSRTETSDGTTKSIVLASRAVTDANLDRVAMSTLKAIGIQVQIWTMPQEVAQAIPFEQRAAYDPEYDRSVGTR